MDILLKILQPQCNNANDRILPWNRKTGRLLSTIGHTYGAVYLEEINRFYPATNPEPGFRQRINSGPGEVLRLAINHTIQEWLRYYLSVVIRSASPELYGVKLYPASAYHQEVEPKCRIHCRFFPKAC